MMSAIRSMIAIVALVIATCVAPALSAFANQFTQAQLRSMVEKIESDANIPGTHFIDLLVKAEFWALDDLPLDFDGIGATVFVPTDSGLTAAEVSALSREEAIKKSKRYFTDNKKWTKAELLNSLAQSAVTPKRFELSSADGNSNIAFIFTTNATDVVYVNNAAKLIYETDSGDNQIHIHVMDDDVPLKSSAQATTTIAAILGALTIAFLK